MNRKVKYNLAWELHGYRAENRFFYTDENFKKSPHLLTLIFLPS